MKAPIINTDRLELIPLSLQHVTDSYVSWLNDEDVYKYLESGGNYTLSMLYEYVDNAVKKDIYFWAIHTKNKNNHIGNIKIDPINTRHNIAEYGIMMGEKNEWGKGYAKEASLVVIEFCFEILGIRKLNLGVVSKNKSAIKLYEKIGFVQESLLKKHGVYSGELCDIIRMSIFNPNIS
ncbi:MAG: GNAT family N-acetyltransferase [Bacteroidales bacterium]